MTVAHGLGRSPDASVPANAGSELSDDTLTAFRLGVTRLARRMRLESATEEVNVLQHNVLAVICRTGPLTPGELASIERVTPPSMTRAVNALAEAGLVDKLPHPTDGRQVVVSLTPQGHDVLTNAREIRTAWLRDHLSILTPEEQAMLIAATPLLERLADS